MKTEIQNTEIAPKRRIIKSTDQFIDEVHRVNPHNLILDEAVYTKGSDKVIVRCGDCGHKFEAAAQQLIHNHKPSGCPKCSKARLMSAAMSKINKPEDLERQFRDVHGDTYEYYWDTYTTLKVKMKMRCPIHGDFEQMPLNHRRGAICLKCSLEDVGGRKRITYQESVARSRGAHGDRYEYPEDGYRCAGEKMTIVCKDHGEFEQVANDHWDGHGCGKCTSKVSDEELQLLSFINSLGIRTEHGAKMSTGFELDIVCPDLRIAFEYNGLYRHSESCGRGSNYHLSKTLMAETEGLRLIHVFSDDWMNNRSKTQKWVAGILGYYDRVTYARDTSVVNLDWPATKLFLDLHHMQGSGSSSSSYRYGLIDKDSHDVVAVMTFSSNSSQPGCIELTRFCSYGRVVGGFSKLLKAFITEHSGQYSSVISFSDKSWSTGEVYLSNGFSKVSTIPPDYSWYKSGKRHHKFGFRRKYLPSKLASFDPNKSESENCLANGYHKVWDCGKDKWVLKLL